MDIDHNNSDQNSSLSTKQILTTWLPLVGSWLLMSIEKPAINAIIARLPDSEINLAAYGSVSLPIAIIINAPGIMLLAVATALSRDWNTYQKLKKITLLIGGVLSAIHLLIAVTPIYDFIVTILMEVPQEVVEPGRIGLICLTSLSFGVSFRRFQQGTMIRFGHSNMVWETTVARLVIVSLILVIGMVVKTIPGTLLAGLSQGLGVLASAIYAGLRIRKIKAEIKAAPPVENPLTSKQFIRFYLPLALTSTLLMLWQPLVSAAVSRMPDPLASLAVWSVISGLLNTLRSPGMAYREAVVAMLDKKNAYPILRKFTLISSIILVALTALFVLSPLSEFWFSTIANLASDIVSVARTALTFGIAAIWLRMYLSLYEGIIVNQGKTNAVAEAVIVFLISLSIVLIVGVVSETFKGVYVAVAAYMFANLMQTLWLMLRSRKNRKLIF